MDEPMWLKREAMTRCGHCGERQPVAIAAVGYQCRACATDWRWAVCGNCELVQVAREELEAFVCARCHAVQVAWWKTRHSESLAGMVSERRREDDARRRRVRRAWVAVGGLLLGLALLGLWLAFRGVARGTGVRRR
jgi:hypothetical protein